MVLRTEAVKAFLNAKTHKDLANLYCKEMEVQVNVSQGKGSRIETGAPGTKGSPAYTDGIETWKAFRIPHKAMTDPVDNDGPQKWNFDEHTEGIGMTGWDWKNKLSRWVAYDFDSMMGHSDKHTKKLTEAQLHEIQRMVTDLEFVTLRKSTSGKGLHLYIFLDPVTTETHTEHAALARSILSYISGITGYSFTEKVDICGGNMWVWHKKMLGTDGLQLIRQGTVFPKDRIPGNWKDHLNVISRRNVRVTPKMEGVPEGLFEELSGQRAKVRTDEEHRSLINWLHEHNYPGWWDQDNHMLITHTYYLKEAHASLKFRGQFETNSSGREAGHDINCFMFPTKGGSWAIRRYGIGTAEHKLWVQDGKGWTRCYYNRDLNLDDVARLFDAVELEAGGYQFPSVTSGRDALLKLGVDLTLPDSFNTRVFKVKESRNDYKLLVLVPALDGDTAISGWVKEKGHWRRLFNNPRAGLPDEAIALGDYDDIVRHIISENGEDLGWVVNTDDDTWRYEPITHVRLLLESRGIGKKDVGIILGRAVSQAWVVVNKPFQPEYPGDRQWNKSTARFKVVPTLDGESLSFPTWQKVLSHCGRSLDAAILENPWCKQNGILNGADYLRLWLASLIKYPQQPLPYLAFYGPQDSGKSTFHEAFCQLILDGGYMDGATALQSTGNFNGELQDSILLTLEEVDLCKGPIYNRVKDWVTSNQISIHIKGQTPYKAPNYTHWIQSVNDRNFIPAFPGDTRLTIMQVESLSEQQKIPKRDLWVLLTKEASDFLAALLSTEIPDSRDRLMIPVINTADKIEAEYSNMDPVQQFFKEQVVRASGAYVSAEDLFTRFVDWVGVEEGTNWSKVKFGKMVPQDIPRGRISALAPDQRTFYGNITFDKDFQPTKRWLGAGLWLKREA